MLVKNNAQMSENTNKIIINHAPIFTVGHNVYMLNNVGLDSPFSDYCISTSSIICENVSNLGFIMSISGEINVDILR